MGIFENKSGEASEKKLTAAKPGKSLVGILLQPRLSEKAGKLAQANQYVFKVARSANKISVKKAVEGAYQVKVVRVNIVNVQGKTRRYGKTVGRSGNFKKAVVTLKEGDKIAQAAEVV